MPYSICSGEIDHNLHNRVFMMSYDNQQYSSYSVSVLSEHHQETENFTADCVTCI